jgi:hypothetical protein
LQAPPTIFLADSNPALLPTLVEVLRAHEIAAAVNNGAVVFEQVAALRPDLGALDIPRGDSTRREAKGAMAGPS